MKIKLYSILISLFAIIMSFTLFSCSDEEEGCESGSGNNSSVNSSSAASDSSTDNSTLDSTPHEHTFSKDGWVMEERGHYRACVCHPEIKNYADHTDTVDKDGLCDVCQFLMESEKVITVTVKDADGKPVVGAIIKIYTQSVEHYETTDENGTCSGTFIYTNNLRAMIDSLPEGYIRPEKAIFSIESDNLTITVEKKQ